MFLLCDLLAMRFAPINHYKKQVDGKTALIHLLNGGKIYNSADSTIAYFMTNNQLKTIDSKNQQMNSLLELEHVLKNNWYIVEGEI